MEKKQQERYGLPWAVLIGTGIGLLLLLILMLAVAALIWGDLIPAKTPSLVLSLMAGVCAFTGGRGAVKCSRGGTLPAGGLVGGSLCCVLTAVCLGTEGEIGFPGPWFATLIFLFAGGCLAGLMRRRKNKK